MQLIGPISEAYWPKSSKVRSSTLAKTNSLFGQKTMMVARMFLASRLCCYNDTVS